MSETLRDLVVSLSLNSDNFTRNIKSVNSQIKVAESEFKLAAAGVEGFEKSTSGLSAKLSQLKQTLDLQKVAVGQYEQALEKAKTRLADCQNQQSTYAARLEAARKEEARLAAEVQAATEKYEAFRGMLSETDSAVIADRTNLEALKKAHADCAADVKKLEGQHTALQKSTQNAADAVRNSTSNLNNARAAVKQTQADVERSNQALILARTAWTQAGEAILQSRQAISSIGKQVQIAENQFKSSTAGMKDLDTSADGLAARLTLLQTRFSLQQQALRKYEETLASARVQLQAAKDANDPGKIKEATAAVEDAEVALSRARAETAQTSAAIGETNQKLALARTAWAQAGDTILQSRQAIASIGRQLQIAENQFKASTAGMKNLDTSADGLAARLSLLQTRLSLQQQALQKYQEALAAARVQLQAARDANDPDKIREATAAVEDAEVALSKARAEIAQTGASIEEISKKLTVASSAWTKAGAAMETFGKRCSGAGKSLTAAGKALTKTIATPVAALGTAAVKASIDFESSFADVRKTVDATETQFADLSAASKRMSTQVAASTSEINQVMATGGQLGIATANLESFTRTMIDLGNSCEDLNADEAASSLAKFANIMGTDQSRFQNLGSAIVDLGNNFATTEKPIMEMAMRLAGAGKQVGLTEAQVLGFAAAMSSVGIEAQMGGSAFSKALIKMEVASETGGQALEDFARVSDMTAAEFKSLWDSDPAAAFQAFIVGLSKLDEEGESAIVTLNDIGISEIRLRDTLLRSTNATELFANAQETATRAFEENVALSNEASKRYATTESRLANLKNTAILFGQQIGDDLNPTIQNLIDGANGLLEKFNGLDAAQRQSIVRFAAYAAAAGPVLLALGKLNTGVGKAASAVGKFMTGVGQAGGGVKGLLSVLSKSPAAWCAVAAAVAAGAAALIDYASGAKQAREALEGMQKTADSWKRTAADTFYGSSEGLAFFGLSEADFAKSGEDAVRSSQEWLSGLLAVWTDGKIETNAIVSEWTESWKSLTAGTREGLQALKGSADAGGHTSLSEQLQADLDLLDSMDTEIAKLLKKRQGGFFSEKEKLRLQELIDTREAISIKYNLVPADSGAEGFDAIRQKLQAETARAQARGQQDADVSAYENAVVAAAEGMAALNSQLDEQYDKEYAIVQLMADEDERKAAQAALDQQYNSDRYAAAQAYAALLKDVIAPVWAQDDIQQAGEDIDTLAAKLREYSAASEGERPALLEDLNQLSENMDEGAVAEYIALLTQVQSLLDSGMSESEVSQLFPELDFSHALDQLAGIQTFLNGRKTLLPGLTSMFGEALPEEVLQIATDLDMTGAQARWDAFAENPGAITTDAVIQSLDASQASAAQQPYVDAVIRTFRENPEGADFSALSIDSMTATVVSYAEAAGVSLSALSAQQLEAIVSAYAEATGCDKSQLLQSLSAHITAYEEAPGVSVPRPQTVIAITGYDLTASRSFVQAHPVEVNGVVRLSDVTGDPSSLAGSENVNIWADGVKIPVTAQVLEKLSPDSVVALEADGTMHILITPEIRGTKEAVEQAGNALEKDFVTASIFGNASQHDWGILNGLLGGSMMDWVRSYTSELNNYAQNIQGTWKDFRLFGSTAGDYDKRMAEQFSPENIAGLQTFVAEAVAAIKNGEQISDEDMAHLQSIVDFLNALELTGFDETTQVGADVSAGIAEGMTEAGWDASAQTVASDLEEALRTALQTHSPSQLTRPIGTDVADGVGAGMAEANMTAHAQALAGNLTSALSSALSPSAFRSIGVSAMAGLAAGVRSGQASVVSAMRAAARATVNAAKSELKIHSPSRVFEDEVGRMAMRGLGQGYLLESKKQAGIIRNATRYLTGEAKSGAIVTNASDNRKTYNQNSTVSFAGSNFYINDRQDAYSLAVEIASLTRRQQRGKGLRMA